MGRALVLRFLSNAGSRKQRSDDAAQRPAHHMQQFAHAVTLARTLLRCADNRVYLTVCAHGFQAQGSVALAYE